MATTTDKTKKLGWHFLPKSMSLDYGDGRKAAVGKTLAVKNTEAIRCCINGMHASTKIKDAAQYEKGPVLTRVEVSGDIDECWDGKKFAGRERKVLWAKEITHKDANEIGKVLGDLGMIEAGLHDTIKYILSSAASNGDRFERAMRNWAAKNGCPGVKAKALKPVPPPFSLKDVLARLDTRTVVTKHELLRDLAAAGFGTRATDGSSADRLQELIDEGELDGKVHVIEDFTRHGGVGLLRVNRK